jgi:transcription elongation factor GreB
MSRYRPPRSAGTPLITPEGEARMRAELHELWHVRRPQVTQSVSEAAAQGDRSENAENTPTARRCCVRSIVVYVF